MQPTFHLVDRPKNIQTASNLLTEFSWGPFISMVVENEFSYSMVLEEPLVPGYHNHASNRRGRVWPLHVWGEVDQLFSL